MINRRRQPALVRKPILGFGLAGWCLLPVALALLIILLTGYDLRFELLRLINNSFGWRSVFWIVAHILPFHWVELIVSPWPPYPDFGIVPMCILLIAMHLHPRRHGPVAYAIVVLWGLLAPVLVGFIAPWVNAHLISPPPPTGINDAVFLSQCIRALITIAVIAFVTRSRWIILALSLVTAIFLVVNHEVSAGGFGKPLWLPWLNIDAPSLIAPWAWHLTLYAGLFIWALRARAKVFRSGHCQRCGYNLAGAPSSTCPECGHDQSSAVTPAPDAANNTLTPVVDSSP